MKLIITPLLVLLIMTQAFSKWIMITECNIYRSYIVKKLCENRYRPQLHCNGKCVLMKKMAASEGQSSPAGPVIVNLETILFIDEPIEYLGKNFPACCKEFGQTNFSYTDNAFVTGVFRPPLV